MLGSARGFGNNIAYVLTATNECYEFHSANRMLMSEQGPFRWLIYGVQSEAEQRREQELIASIQLRKRRYGYYGSDQVSGECHAETPAIATAKEIAKRYAEFDGLYNCKERRDSEAVRRNYIVTALTVMKKLMTPQASLAEEMTISSSQGCARLDMLWSLPTDESAGISSSTPVVIEVKNDKHELLKTSHLQQILK